MRDVCGYEGIYKISESGEVYNCKKERFIKTVNGGDYLRVFLFKGGVQKMVKPFFEHHRHPWVE